MPITPFQRIVLKLLAANRSPDSYVAGATIINRQEDSPRFSKDVDLFHDPEASILECSARDIEVLESNAFEVAILLRQPGFVRCVISKRDESIKLEWASDSAFRFFPVIADPDFGFRLHDADVAINKCLALANRTEARDVIDMMEIHEKTLHLGHCCWAACGKDPGFTPDLVLDLVSRNARLTPDLIAAENLRVPIDIKDLKRRWLAALNEARTCITELPAKELGCLYINQAGEVSRTPATGISVQPHYGSVRGGWPTILS